MAILLYLCVCSLHHNYALPSAINLLLPSYKPELLWDRYLSDVNEGDGGLLVVESSHKAAFERPTPHLFAPFGGGNPVPADQVAGVPWDMRAAVGLKNVVPVRAGDVLVMPEALTHAVMP